MLFPQHPNNTTSDSRSKITHTNPPDCIPNNTPTTVPKPSVTVYTYSPIPSQTIALVPALIDVKTCCCLQTIRTNAHGIYRVNEPLKHPSLPASCRPVENAPETRRRPNCGRDLSTRTLGAVRVTGRWTSCSSVQAQEHGPGAPVPPEEEWGLWLAD